MDVRSVGTVVFPFYGLCFGMVTPAAWITHLVFSAMMGEWVLLVAGAFVYPLGMAHGIWLWFV
ncbi:hypothetical protein [Kiloniella sp. b19]|uniref:hypothetical protein n=1 Tax=Kiloniella sp. GXU_MW_B19 TaxID=3141326 RepID=UPI0031CF71EB